MLACQVIDVGFNVVNAHPSEGGGGEQAAMVCGDVAFDEALGVAGLITPVNTPIEQQSEERTICASFPFSTRTNTIPDGTEACVAGVKWARVRGVICMWPDERGGVRERG